MRIVLKHATFDWSARKSTSIEANTLTHFEMEPPTQDLTTACLGSAIVPSGNATVPEPATLHLSGHHSVTTIHAAVSVVSQ